MAGSFIFRVFSQTGKTDSLILTELISLLVIANKKYISTNSTFTFTDLSNYNVPFQTVVARFSISHSMTA